MGLATNLSGPSTWKFIEALEDVAEVEQKTKFEGRRLVVILKPSKKSAKKNKSTDNA